MAKGTPFKKGQSGNPKGKPKGAKGKKALAWEKIGKKFTEEWADRFMNIMSGAPDKEFLQYYGMFLEYFKPKLQRTDLTSGNEPLSIHFDSNLKDV